MKRLTILYDGSCNFCRRCVEWIQSQPSYLEMECIPSQSEQARRRFPGLKPELTANELTVVDDTGGVYYGERAYIICLYGLRNYREWSIRLSAPEVRPFVKRAFGALANSRSTLSVLFSEVGSEYNSEPAAG